MEWRSVWRFPLAVLCITLASCASVSRTRNVDKVDAALAARGAPAAGWPADGPDARAIDERVSDLLAQPITVERSVEIAFLRNAEIKQAYAQLGFAQADVLEASRLSNPRIGYIALKPDGGGLSQITRSVTVPFSDLLLLHARTRLARNEYERVHQSVGAALLDLAVRVESAWFDYVSVQQVAQMRGAVARNAESSATFAQRLSDAGNLTPRDLALELAAASEARVLASRAQAEVIRRRGELADLLGVSTREPWQVTARMPAPPMKEALPAQMVDAALASRLDVSATRSEVQILEQSLGLTRRWRWLGNVEVGYERESETDGARLKGPTVSAEIPLFNQNRHGVLRAQAALEASRARLASLELSVRNEVSVGLDHLDSAREIAEAYRTALVPQREAVVERTQEQFNYMLIGAFELLQAKREEFNAYQEYLEAVRDYWLARVTLKRAVGGRLPGEEEPTSPTIGVEELLAPPKDSMEGMDHSMMDSNMDHSQMRDQSAAPNEAETSTESSKTEEPAPHHEHGEQPKTQGENRNE